MDTARPERLPSKGTADGIKNAAGIEQQASHATMVGRRTINGKEGGASGCGWKKEVRFEGLRDDQTGDGAFSEEPTLQRRLLSPFPLF